MELELLFTALLVFARLGGLLLALPVVSAQGVPRHVQVFGALILTLLVLPNVVLSPVAGTLGLMALALSAEIFVGVLMGSVVNAIFGAFALGCDVMSQQMGFAMANLFNPLQKTQQGAIATLGSWLAGLVFLGSGLHMMCIGVAVDTFQSVPPGGVSSLVEGSHVLMEAVADSITLGTKLAGPVLILVWLVNVFVAVLTKMAPRMNVYFSVGMILVNVVGLGLFGVSLPFLLDVHQGKLLDVIARMGFVVVGG